MSKNFIESVLINKLHGYKTVILDLSDSPQIFIAENGSGKTAVFKILNDFLTLDIVSLKNIEFDSIKVKLKSSTSSTKIIEITKKNIYETIIFIKSSLKKTILSHFSTIDFEDLLQFTTQEYENEDFSNLIDHYIVDHLFRNTPMHLSEIDMVFSALSSEIYQCIINKDNPLFFYFQEIQKINKKFEINYLPTYRRIEIAPRTLSFRDNLNKEEQKIISHKDSSKHMHFGISDILDRIREMHKEMNKNIFRGFINLSNNYIQQTLNNNMSNKNTILPNLNDVEKLLKKSSKDNYEQTMVLLENAYKDDSVLKNNNLMIFLNQINEIIKKNRYFEKKIIGFVESINKFLLLSGEEKYLCFDPEKFEVSVNLKFNDNLISFDDLSSGEKQIIGLLGSIYLSNKPQIILIDEPEISLSIKWQRILLPALVEANPNNQIICITHSPFIFENEFDNNALPLYMKKEFDLIKPDSKVG
ncbi:AAA family ATPase [Acinetobacter guillouiae]|uniref:AAA family ATPase n=1 Tax=Acinetobacter guillouiae TaxID=106649 RepID=UPI003AF6C40B